MSFSLWDLLVVFLIIMVFLPTYQQRKREALRWRLMQRIQEREGGVRIIAMIHRQESLSLLGLSLQRFIDIEDSEQVLRGIRSTDDKTPIDLLLHTPGGLVLASEQIAQALAAHPARVRVLVPHYAMSGGTLLALAADEIVMDENAVLGPIDPQLGRYPAASILEAVRLKGMTNVDDDTLVYADLARKAMIQVKHNAVNLLKRKHPIEEAKRIGQALTEGRWTHDYPLNVEELRALGISVKVGLCDEVYQLMDLYPQPSSRRPSVQYIPPPPKRTRPKANG